MTMRAMWCESGSPMSRQVAPASVDLNTPLPEYDDRALAWSPVPIQTTCELDGAMATAPTAAAPTASDTGFHVVPALVVFQSPPLRLAAYIVYRWSRAGVSGTATSVIQAAVRNGPMLRKARPLRTASSIGCS